MIPKTFRKKIAFVTPIYLPANLTGSGVVVKLLAEYLVKESYDISVVTSNALTPRYWYDFITGKKIYKSFEIINGVKVYRLPCNQILSTSIYYFVRVMKKFIPKHLFQFLWFLSSGPYLVGLDRVLQQENFSLIHVSPFPYYINKQVCDYVKRMNGEVELIVTPFFHSKVREYKNNFLKSVLDIASKVHVVTQTEAQALAGFYPKIKNKLVVIPLFAEQHKNYSTKSKKKIINKYNLSNRKIVLYVGVKSVSKGAIKLLIAVDKLYKRDPNYLLIALGQSTTDWMQAKKNINISSILDLGYVSTEEKDAFFSLCDIFCMPSISESFGLVYLEAWQWKKPVIAANIPAVKEVVQNTGVLIDPVSISNIKSAIKKLMKSKRGNELGLLGKKRLKKNYQFPRLYRSYKKLFGA